MSGDAADTWNRRQFAWNRAMLAARLSPAHRLVALALASFANGHSGECWPSAGEIAEVANVAVRTVLRALPELEGAGLVAVDRRCGRGRRSVYRMTLPAHAPRNVVSLAAVSAPSGKVAKPVDNRPVKGDKRCQPVTVSQSETVTSCPGNGDILSSPYKEELSERTSRGAREAGGFAAGRRWAWCRGGVLVDPEGSAVARWRRWCAEWGFGDPVTLCPVEGGMLRLPAEVEPDAGSVDEGLAAALFRSLEVEAAEAAQSESRRQA